jgi:hypothetical protein
MKTPDLDRKFSTVMGSDIFIDVPVALYRAYDTRRDAVGDRVMHFQSRSCAERRARSLPHLQLGCFTNDWRRLRLIDVRYVHELLRQMMRSVASRTEDDAEAVARFAVAYGLCSPRDQVALAEALMPDADATRELRRARDNASACTLFAGVDPFALGGTRLCDATNDALVLMFLKRMFGEHVDGLVSPRVDGPLRVAAEIVLFDPKRIGVRQIDVYDGAQAVPIDQMSGWETRCCSSSSYGTVSVVCKDSPPRASRHLKEHVSDTSEFFDRIDDGDERAMLEAQKMHAFFERVQESMRVAHPYARHPCQPVAPWLTDEQLQNALESSTRCEAIEEKEIAYAPHPCTPVRPWLECDYKTTMSSDLPTTNSCPVVE